MDLLTGAQECHLKRRVAWEDACARFFDVVVLQPESREKEKTKDHISELRWQLQEDEWPHLAAVRDKARHVKGFLCGMRILSSFVSVMIQLVISALLTYAE